MVCITCNHCPVAVAYEDRHHRLRQEARRQGRKVGFVAINVNNLEQDKLPAMKVRAKEKGFNFPYAYDPSQKIAQDLGASVTPEFYVFNKNRKLVYQGAMDDNNDAPKATNYLEQAVQAGADRLGSRRSPPGPAAAPSSTRSSPEEGRAGIGGRDLAESRPLASAALMTKEIFHTVN